MKMDREILVSVIIPAYNRSSLLKRAIESVRRQTYGNWEIIVIDDGSEDDTEDQIRKLEVSGLTYVRNEKNRGANYSRNRGIKLSKGEYIAFLDSDNEWVEDKLELQCEALNNAHEKVGFVFCRFFKHQEDDTYIMPNIENLDQEKILDIMFKENLIDTNTVLIKRECFEKAGYFDENLPKLQDWEMFLRVLFIGNYNSVFMEKVLVHNWIQKDSLTVQNRTHVEALMYILEKYLDEITKRGVLDSWLKQILEWRSEEFPTECRIENLFQIVDGNRESKSYFLSYLKRRVFDKQYFLMMKKWDKYVQGGLIEGYLNSCDIKNVALYGLGNCGRRLYHELEGTGIKVLYGIDKTVMEYKQLPVYKAVNTEFAVDGIIITSVYYYDEICRKLRNQTTVRLISLEDIISEISAGQGNSNMKKAIKERIGLHWTKESQKKQKRDRWWKSPQIIRHINQTICGEPLDGWNAGGIKLLKKMIPAEARLIRALSVGSGSGDKEMELLKSNLVQEFVCFEFSEGRIRAGEEKAEKNGLSDRIRFFNEDFFLSSYADEKYDMVFWDNSLHHMPDAFAAVEKSYGVLRNGGFFFCNDFVGKSKFQWSDMELAVVNGIRSVLDKNFFANMDGKDYGRIVCRPTIEAMDKMDPSEAADSSSIIPAVMKVFPNSLIIPTGGLVYHLCLNDILVNIKEESDLLEYFLQLDDETIRMGLTQYAFILAKKDQKEKNI